MSFSDAVARVEPVEPAAPPSPAQGPLDLTLLPRVDLCGVRITRFSERDFLRVVTERLTRSTGTPIAVGSVNLDHLHHFGRRRGRPARVSGVAAGPWWVLLADGAPISHRASVRSGLPWPRLAGADLLPRVLDVAGAQGACVGFLGGTAPGAAALQARLRSQWPELRVAGCWTPERPDLLDVQRSRRIAATVADAGVDLLVVGLGKPLQERWIDDHGAQTGARVLAAFGGAAAFLAGSTSRAPRWMRDAGCEWMYRLAVEPRRLSRRYLVQGPPALFSLLTEHSAERVR